MRWGPDGFDIFQGCDLAVQHNANSVLVAALSEAKRYMPALSHSDDVEGVLSKGLIAAFALCVDLLANISTGVVVTASRLESTSRPGTVASSSGTLRLLEPSATF